MTVTTPYHRPGRPIDDVRPATVHVDAMHIGTSAEDYTVPADCEIIVMRGNKDFYVRPAGGDAAVPTDEVADGTGSILNPSTLQVTPGQVLSFIAPAAATIVTIECYTG